MENQSYTTFGTNLERLHLHYSGDDIDILYRPLHAYMEFVKNDEDGLNHIKELALMSREEFAKYIANGSNYFPLSTQSKIQQVLDSKAEEWYHGAWKFHTKEIFEKIGVENPIEKPILTSEIDALRIAE